MTDYSNFKEWEPPPVSENDRQSSYCPLIFRREEKMAPGTRLEMIDPDDGQLRLVFAGPPVNPDQHPEFTIRAKDYKGREVVHVFDGDYKGYIPADELPVAPSHIRRNGDYNIRSIRVQFHAMGEKIPFTPAWTPAVDAAARQAAAQPAAVPSGMA